MFQHLPVVELSWEAFRKSDRFCVGGGVGWLRAESAERLGRQIRAVERAEAELDAEDGRSDKAGAMDPGVLEELTRLRAAHPGWRIEYAEGKGVSWVASRDRGDEWLGGHTAAEAQDSAGLASLITQAVSVSIAPGVRGGGCGR
ncbi:hypothetical protein [Actinomadura pelletieri]|uniref:hypothetical protein n=1 Tax=Actinomadura pelletieri TaxID=111805 RepID=UPI0011C4800E|nr:hypothetical protein [Actinomadura pelletieri]